MHRCVNSLRVGAPHYGAPLYAAPDRGSDQRRNGTQDVNDPASGPAMRARWGVSADELPPEHVAWRIEADYLAQACINLACTLSPEMIVLGGGVMAQKHLFQLVRMRASDLMNGYLALPHIAPPALPYPGLSGALALAMGT